MSLSSVMNNHFLPPTAVDLKVLEGQWPSDISGHAFVIGPIPVPGVPFFLGPAMAHRLDLAPAKRESLAWRGGMILTEGMRVTAMLPPEVRDDPRLMAMIGPVPNSANTALTPISGGRMLASFDAGRPIEIDPERLSYITAVGSVREWKISLPGTVQPAIMTSAHPFYDPFEGRLYTVNERSAPRNGTSLTWNEVDLWLARWDGEGKVERSHVNGTDFSQYVHEVTATKSFVLWADSGVFIIEPGERYGLPRTHPQLPFTDVAIVRKADLAKSPTEVTARVVRIPLEAAHMFADYDDDGQHVTLYLAHANSVELTTSVKPGDINHFTNAPVEPSAVGAFTVADAVPFAKYRIHVDTGQIVESARVLEPQALWGLALYARDSRAPAIGKNRDVFLTYLGYDPKTITTTMIQLYGNHPHRIVPVKDLPSNPIPSCLTRVDLATMTTVDRYAFPAGWLGTSPTWIPATAADRAYVLVHALGEGNAQVWLFDADKLAQGPIARLGHAEFRLPFTLHTAWLPELSPRKSNYRVDFAEEIGQDYRLLPEIIRNTVDQVLAAAR